MNEQNYEELNELSISMEHLVNQIELAEHMVGAIVCSNLTDDEEKTKVHIDRLWSLMTGIVELVHLREKELSELLTVIQIEKPLNNHRD